jgi:hypothetical protein
VKQEWFEMQEVRRHWLREKVWVPLRAIQHLSKVGESGHLGHQEEFFGAGSLAVSLSTREAADALGWMDVGISHSHSGWADGDDYYPADVYCGSEEEVSGTHLILDQHFNSAETSEWHLHQDLVTTLGLRREGDLWVRPDEGYEPVARLERDNEGSPILLEIHASHLRDYLCARSMALFVSSYLSRTAVVADASSFTWDPNPLQEATERDRWQGGAYAIHEGGMPYGESVFVMHSAWKDEFAEGDIPKLGVPTDDSIISESWSRENSGGKLYRIQGELWRSEWIEPADSSPIVRNDKTPPIAFFIVDEQGSREGKDTLAHDGRWLWFRPDVMSSLAHRRGGGIGWFTKDTGQVHCSPDHDVHFGVNSLGLVTVYAKDIALLPDWQQQVWAGYNVAPNGGVSEELLMSQVKASPADTKAPEAFLLKGIDYIRSASVAAFGSPVIREHDDLAQLSARVHRFRAADRVGFFALAKDVARMTADVIDATALHNIVPPPKGEKWGSLKSLEKVLAASVGPAKARTMLSPLVGAYELRHSDAHLSSHEADEALELVKVEPSAAPVQQGVQLLNTCVAALFQIGKVLEEWSDAPPE